jgi:hypothetical protein
LIRKIREKVVRLHEFLILQPARYSQYTPCNFLQFQEAPGSRACTFKTCPRPAPLSYRRMTEVWVETRTVSDQTKQLLTSSNEPIVRLQPLEASMDRNVADLHYHIRWTKISRLDWLPFGTRALAEKRAEQIARPNEKYTVDEYGADCPRCTARAQATL